MSWVNTSPLVKTCTLQEFWDLPEPPDHSKLELIAGVLYMTPPPGYTHSMVIVNPQARYLKREMNCVPMCCLDLLSISPGSLPTETWVTIHY